MKKGGSSQKKNYFGGVGGGSARTETCFIFLFFFILHLPLSVFLFWLVRSYLLITLTNCLNFYKSLGSLSGVMKTLIVLASGVRGTKQGTRSCIELLNMDASSTI